MSAPNNFEKSLHEAARFNNPKVVCALLEAGADIEKRDDEGRTPLCLAALHGAKEASRALIAAGPDVSARLQHPRFVGA